MKRASYELPRSWRKQPPVPYTTDTVPNRRAWSLRAQK